MPPMETVLRKKHLHIRGEDEDALDAATEEEKHLHVRGEDLMRCINFKTPEETPPRTWRRRQLTAASG